MNDLMMDCGDCIHFGGAVCNNCASDNFGGDIICAEDCTEFETQNFADELYEDMKNAGDLEVEFPTEEEMEEMFQDFLRGDDDEIFFLDDEDIAKMKREENLIFS